MGSRLLSSKFVAAIGRFLARMVGVDVPEGYAGLGRMIYTTLGVTVILTIAMGIVMVLNALLVVL